MIIHVRTRSSSYTIDCMRGTVTRAAGGRVQLFRVDMVASIGPARKMSRDATLVLARDGTLMAAVDDTEWAPREGSPMMIVRGRRVIITSPAVSVLAQAAEAA